MKKLVSILLALIMMLSATTITAFAEDVMVDADELFETQYISPSTPDYSAYESILELVEALDEKEYTAESIKAVKDKVVSMDTLKTQEDVNAAVAEIATAYALLKKTSYAVYFVIINSKEEETSVSYTYHYGEVAQLSVDNGEEPYKWILSSKAGDKKLNSGESELEYIVESNTTIYAFTDISIEEQAKLQQVTFLGFNGKPISYVYTNDVENVEMPEAPALPFYYFSEWVKLNDRTYQAKYLSDSICDGTHHRFTVMVSKASCETYGYLIFQCSCGEQYSTDYTKPIGHNFEDDNRYCVNGCGTPNPRFDDFETNDENDSSTDVEQPTSPSNPQTDQHYGFDEGGYSNMVIAP